MNQFPKCLLAACLVFGASASAQETSGLKPFTIDHRVADRSSLDLSWLLNAPAGKSGFLQVRNGHIARPDGTRFRIWGVNLSDFARGSVRFPAKEDAAFWASTLARFGVNCVRIHSFDVEAPKGIIAAGRNDTREFDAQQLDQLDYFVAELKKRGIYCDLNLNVSRTYKAGDGVRDYQLIGTGKALTYFDSRLIELQKEYAGKLLTHYNPYTKSEYRNEPAIAIVELVNENSIVGAWDRGRLQGSKTSGPPQGWQDIPPFYEQQLTELYNAWLARKVAAPVLARLRAEADAKDGQPIPLLRSDQFSAASKERFETELAFYMELESSFFQDMKSYLRQTLGSKSLLIGTSDFTYGFSSYPLLSSASQLDIIDTHCPWELRPIVGEPLNSTPVRVSRSAMAGKPLVVSEHNHRFPNDYTSEGIPLLAAYAAFQDWDGIFLYTFEVKPPSYVPYIGSRADLSHDPVKLPNLATGALMFLRQDIHTALETVERAYTAEQVKESLRVPASGGVYFTPGYSVSVALRHGSRIRSLNGESTQKLTYAEASPIVSDTKELSWYFTPHAVQGMVENDQQFRPIGPTHASSMGTGMVVVDTPRSQALVGFLPEYRRSAANLSADIHNPFATLVLSSLDSKPIAESSQLLLTAGARVSNTGDGPPTRIEPVTGKIVLRNLRDAAVVEVRPMDGAARPVGKPVTAEKTGGGWSIPLGDATTTWYIISVRR